MAAASGSTLWQLLVAAASVNILMLLKYLTLGTRVRHFSTSDSRGRSGSVVEVLEVLLLLLLLLLLAAAAPGPV